MAELFYVHISSIPERKKRKASSAIKKVIFIFLFLNVQFIGIAKLMQNEMFFFKCMTDFLINTFRWEQ